MRCSNCGWMNPDGAATCQKCNQPLEFSPIQSPTNTFDPRATMVAAGQPENNPRATMMETQPSAFNPRATMMETQPPTYNPRATMVDAQQPAVNPCATMVDITQLSSEKSFTLYCMDDARHEEIRIITSSDLELATGEIVFIKNMRYQVK